MDVPTNILNEIANNLEAGEKCFIHKQTLEIVTYPDDTQFSDDEMFIEAFGKDVEKVEGDKNYVEIEKMSSHDSFKVMEDFAESVEDRTTKIRLLTALDGKKPFANFKYQVDNSGKFRELWFAFRKEKIIEWVKDQLDSMPQ